MIQIILEIIKESFELLKNISPFLLIGFIFAGTLYVFIPKDKILKHLGEKHWSSVWKAAIFGIPLPICSCGVLPIAYSLRKRGASEGATLSFLISTPTTGVDSILATYGLLGPVFAVARPIASFIGGIFAGHLSNAFLRKEEKKTKVANNECPICNNRALHNHSMGEKIKKGFSYVLDELVDDIGKWILVGVFIGGIITCLIPKEFVEHYLSGKLSSYLIMLIVGIPLYVCAMGSIPIATSLILKGMSPGAGLVFLIAGPATNATTITVVAKILGKRGLGVYLFSISITALVFGSLLDTVVRVLNINACNVESCMVMVPNWLKLASATILLFLIGRTMFKKKFQMKKVKDLVCGMSVNLGDALRLDYGGKLYYFCSETCREMFKKEPEQYRKKENNLLM